MPTTPIDMYSSKSALYTTIIIKLQDLLPNITPLNLINSLLQIIKKLKIAFEDHLPSISKINEELRQLSPLTIAQQAKIMEIITLVEFSERVNPSDQERFYNYSRRRFETDLALNLLFSPTDNMMQSVKRVSERLVVLINQNKAACFELALRESGPNSSFAETFGRFDHTPSLSEVIKLLRENAKENLPRIFFLHYLLWWSWQHSATEFVVELPRWEHTPNGRFATYLQERLQSYDLTSDVENFRELVHKNVCELSYFCNIYMYKSSLYANRGRKNTTQSRSNCVGLLLANQDREDLQQLSDTKQFSTWGSDVLMVEADFTAPYVKNMFKHHGVYVSGVSGMATFYLSLMETLGNLPDIFSKQNYLAAFSAYIVAGGFHSFHEVFLPSEHFLKLIPEYHADLPIPENNYETQPPNYSAFFDIFTNDQQFNSLHEKVWTTYLADHRKHVPSSNLQSFSIFAGSASLTSVTPVIEVVGEEQPGNTMSRA